MSVYTYPSGDVIELEVLYLEDGLGIPGLNVRVALRRSSDNYYFDFNDSTFKASGWTQQYDTLNDIGSGKYQVAWDSSILSGAAEVLIAEYEALTSGYEAEAQDVLLFGQAGAVTPAQVAAAVWEASMAAHNNPGTFGGGVNRIYDTESGRWQIINNQMVFYKEDNVTEIMRFNLYTRDGQPTEDLVMHRRRAP